MNSAEWIFRYTLRVRWQVIVYGAAAIAIAFVLTSCSGVSNQAREKAAREQSAEIMRHMLGNASEEIRHFRLETEVKKPLKKEITK
jgi:uncharacterized membrane protein YagU involved in acid resistance